MTKNLNKLQKAISSVVVFFHRKKMVHAIGYEPAQLYKAIEVKGVKHLRVIATNITKGANGHPMYDIPITKVVYVRRMASPFDLWLNKITGRKVVAKSTIVQIEGGYKPKTKKTKR